MSVRLFTGVVGVLLVAAGAVLIVLHRLQVFQTCHPKTDVYTTTEVCTQSPAVLIVGVVLAAIGLVTLLGAVLVDRK